MKYTQLSCVTLVFGSLVVGLWTYAIAEYLQREKREKMEILLDMTRYGKCQDSIYKEDGDSVPYKHLVSLRHD